jgi:hypothetical protein
MNTRVRHTWSLSHSLREEDEKGIPEVSSCVGMHAYGTPRTRTLHNTFTSSTSSSLHEWRF